MNMERPKITDAQCRLRVKSFDAILLFNRRSSFACEMQSQDSGEELTKLMKRLRNKSWAIGSSRRNSFQHEKRGFTSSESHDRRASHGSRHSPGYQFEGHKAGPWDIKTLNLPKRWLKEYEKKQVSFNQLFFLRKVIRKTASMWGAT